jgi:hypothetical protein
LLKKEGEEGRVIGVFFNGITSMVENFIDNLFEYHDN